MFSSVKYYLSIGTPAAGVAAAETSTTEILPKSQKEQFIEAVKNNDIEKTAEFIKDPKFDINLPNVTNIYSLINFKEFKKEILDLIITKFDINLAANFILDAANTENLKTTLSQETFKYLQEKGMKIDYDLIFNSGAGDNVKILEFLADRGLDFTAIDNNECTFVDHCAERGYYDGLAFLLGRGCKWNMINESKLLTSSLILLLIYGYKIKQISLIKNSILWHISEINKSRAVFKDAATEYLKKFKCNSCHKSFGEPVVRCEACTTKYYKDILTKLNMLAVENQ